MPISSKVAVVVAFLLLSLPPAARSAGVPVYDAKRDATATLEHLESIAKWADQLASMKAQIDLTREQLKNFSGTRFLGELLSDPTFLNYLPEDWVGTMGSLARIGLPALPPEARRVIEQSGLTRRCARYSDNERSTCEAELARSALSVSMAEEAYRKAEQRVNQITGLMRAINSTTDSKSIEELQARIGAEQALLQNEATKLALFQQISASQEEMIEQRARANYEERLRRTGGINFDAIRW